MKLYLAALLFSLLLVVAYSVLDSIVSAVYFGGILFFSEGPIYFPLSLPRTLYTLGAPAFLQDAAAASPLGTLAERFLFLVANVVLYSIPIFLVIRIIFKKKAAS